MEAGARNKKVLVLGLLALVAMAVGLAIGVVLVSVGINNEDNEMVNTEDSEELGEYNTVVEVFNASGSASTTASGSGE